MYIGEIIQVRKYYAICKVSSMDEKSFEVEIPIEEVEFINIYIQNMMVRSFYEYEGMEE